MIPKRIQRKRSKDWKMPANTVYVGRPSKWGNPFKVGDTVANHFGTEFTINTKQEAVNCYKNLILTKINPGFILGQPFLLNADLSELKGKNLACWCKEGEVCHADVLLELANY
jgi:hypothetical protein